LREAIVIRCGDPSDHNEEMASSKRMRSVPEFVRLIADPHLVGERRLDRLASKLPEGAENEPTEVERDGQTYSYPGLAGQLWLRVASFWELALLNRLYLKGYLGQSLNHFAKLMPETDAILHQLQRLCRAGDVVTTGSQPASRDEDCLQRGYLMATLPAGHCVEGLTRVLDRSRRAHDTSTFTS